MAISSLRTRFADTAQVEIKDDHIGRLGDQHIRPSVFNPASAQLDSEVLGFDPDWLTDDRQAWSSTKPEAFALKQQCLIHALLQTDPQYWSSLWLASLYRPHTLISKDDGRTFMYIELSTQNYMVAWELEHDNGVCRFPLEASRARLDASTNLALNRCSLKPNSVCMREFVWVGVCGCVCVYLV